MTPARRVKTLLFRLYQQAHRCFHCSCDLALENSEPTLDHVIPKSLTWISKNADQPDNCVAACASCNYRKADKSPDNEALARLAELNKTYSDELADEHYLKVVRMDRRLYEIFTPSPAKEASL